MCGKITGRDVQTNNVVSNVAMSSLKLIQCSESPSTKNSVPFKLVYSNITIDGQLSFKL